MTADIPFSRPVRVESLPRDGLTQKSHADEAERVALAREFGLVAIADLKAEFRLARAGRGVRVCGAVTATITQTCIASLEPFEAEIDEAVDVRFEARRDDAKRCEPAAEQTFTLADEDEPDPIVDGKIDLGALAAEFLALGLDPYPRKPGVEFESAGEDGDEEEKPLWALGGLKTSQNE